MLIHILLSVSMACAEERSAYFVRQTSHSVVPTGHPALVRCAVECAVKGFCMSFNSDAHVSLCTLSTEPCKHGDSICYRRESSEGMRTNHSKLKILNTNKTYRNPQRQADPRVKKGSARLLLIPYLSQSRRVMELDLQTKSIQEYHDEKVKNVLAVTYMPQSLSLLLSVLKPSKIVVSPLKGGQQRFLIKAAAHALAVDELSNFTFLAVRRLRGVLCRMSTDGSHFKRITPNQSSFPLKLATDTESKLLYVSYGSCIYVLSYSGISKRKLDCSDYIKAMCFDDEGKLLYYIKYLHLMKRSSTHATKVRRLSSINVNIDAYRNSVYVAPAGSGDIDVCEFEDVDVNRNSSCKKIVTVSYISGILICVVKS